MITPPMNDINPIKSLQTSHCNSYEDETVGLICRLLTLQLHIDILIAI